MNIYLKKTVILYKLTDALEAYEAAATPTRELLYREALYAKHLFLFFDRSPLKGPDNVAPYAAEQLENGFKRAFENICKVLNRFKKAPGHLVYNVMADRQFLVRKDINNFNRHLAGQPDGLQPDEWAQYNHALFLFYYWEALLMAQTVEYKRSITMQPDTLFRTLELYPMWAMWLTALDTDMPVNGSQEDQVPAYLPANPEYYPLA